MRVWSVTSTPRPTRCSSQSRRSWSKIAKASAATFWARSIRWLDHLRKTGSRGVHLGVSTANHRAIRFYRAYGFDEFQFANPRATPDSLYFVMAL